MWEPVLNPVISYTLDSQLMEGNTYLEHSALGVSLDSGPTEGASFLEPWKQSVPGSLLAVRPVEGVTEKVSEWKPVLDPVISYTLDSRPMKGTTYRERSAPGVFLDSGRTEGASCLKLLEQSVLHSTLVVRQVGSVTELGSDWKPVINPVQDITPDGRPMEETAYLEHLALGASLDSGLRAGMSSIELLRQSVLYMSSVIRPDDTDRPEHQALASQMHHKQSRFKSSAWPMPDPDLNVYTDVNMDINTDLPESIASMKNSPRDHAWSYFNPSARARPMPDTDVVIHTDVNADIATDLLESSVPMMNSGLIVLDSTAAMLNSQKDHEQLHCNLSARPILDPDVVIHLDVNVDIDADLPENSAPMMDSDLIVLDAVIVIVLDA